MTASNPSTVVRRLRSSGDAGVGVMRDPEHDDRMCAVLSLNPWMSVGDDRRVNSENAF